MNQQTDKLGGQLENEFQLFNELSDQFVSSYTVLENHVSKFSNVLLKKQDGRVNTIEDKEQVTKNVEELLIALDEFVLIGDELNNQSLRTRLKITKGLEGDL